MGRGKTKREENEITKKDGERKRRKGKGKRAEQLKEGRVDEKAYG
jgi:hypothetical protein